MTTASGIANIKVIGVGGGGNNAINRMIFSGVTSATFIAANTDMQALNMSHAQIKLQLGSTLTKGLGAGSDPEIGKRAAEESKEEIKAILQETDLLFITAGMGGGTGTGAAPVIAEMAKEMGILTVAVVTKPFERFEGRVRMDNAEKGISELKKYVDTLLVIPNEKLQQFMPKGTPFIKAFQAADDVLRQGIQGISEIIMTPSLINLDFNDIKTIIKAQGNAHIGIGRGKGERRTFDAVKQAVQSTLLETNIGGATGILIYVAGDQGLTMDEVYDSVGLIREVVSQEAKIIFGMGIDDNLNGEVVITVIATGFQTKPDGSSNYGLMQRQIFTEKDKDMNKRMSTMYGYQESGDLTNEKKPDESVRGRENSDNVNNNNVENQRIPVSSNRLPAFLQKRSKNLDSNR
ncbi:MAG: cell division protein FtsZ [Clostridia bacterium]|nr:cell division protein FtsZ [Clostridia bacterium]